MSPDGEFVERNGRGLLGDGLAGAVSPVGVLRQVEQRFGVAERTEGGESALFAAALARLFVFAAFAHGRHLALEGVQVGAGVNLGPILVHDVAHDVGRQVTTSDIPLSVDSDVG